MANVRIGVPTNFEPRVGDSLHDLAEGRNAMSTSVQASIALALALFACGNSPRDGGTADASTADAPPDAVATDARADDTGLPEFPDARADAGPPCAGTEIVSPVNQTTSSGTSLLFVGRAHDASCASITGAALVWIDSLDGQIGTGEVFSHTVDTPGLHIVTLTATDSHMQQYTATVTITVN